MPASVFDTKMESVYKQLLQSSFLVKGEPWIAISVARQRLYLFKGKYLQLNYPVSTAQKGTGCQKDSYQTPLGLHQVIEKIGEDALCGQIFSSRILQNEIARIETKAISTRKDLITSRIIRLSGLEYHYNFAGNVDTYERYIYIHGTHEEGLIGKAVSHGCIRMKNKDIIELFEQVVQGMLVYIAGDTAPSSKRAA